MNDHGFHVRGWSVRLRGCLVVVSLFVAGGERLFADPAEPQRAMKVVRGWLRADPRPFETPLSNQIAETITYTNAAGEADFHVVHLDPTGYVIVPADDEFEPIIAFVEVGRFDPSPTNPMGALVGADIPRRMAVLRTRKPLDIPAPPADSSSDPNPCRQRWATFEAMDDMPGPPGLSTLTDIRVSPLVQSKWNQTTAAGLKCYNYYTPNNYPCGCVATAMAQLMRYHQYPTAYNGRTLNWANMPLVPTGSITLAQRQEIGNLCYQAGLAVDMEYGYDGSSASVQDASRELRNSFGYSNSIFGKRPWPYSNSTIPSDALIKMVNPSLDAALPTIFAILDSGADYGHAIVCDGYGYSGTTLYHHLNMGWSGYDDAWYALPNIDGNLDSYDTIYGCIYNIYTSGSGEIISGRITDKLGRPVGGAVVSTKNGTITNISNERGVYALANLSSNTAFTVAVTRTGWTFSSKNVSTGKSSDGTATCGNVWGINFVGLLSAGTVALQSDLYVPGDTIMIVLIDNDLNGRGSQTVTLTTTAGDSESVLLVESSSEQGYFSGSIVSAHSPCSPDNGILNIWQGQTITVTYNDLNNGSGQAVTATDTAGVSGTVEIVFEDEFETTLLDPAWSIVDGGDTADTWHVKNTPDSYGNGRVMIVDSDSAGDYFMEEQLILQLDCTGLTSIALQFDHHFKYYPVLPHEVGDVDISVSNGAWQNLVRYQSSSFNGRVHLSLPASAEGQSNVRIRWHYYNADWDYYWLIDNVRVTAARSHTPPTVEDVTYYLARGQTESISLSASDDGFPFNRLQYWILSLPHHGQLSDPDYGIIGENQLPYPLAEGNKAILYTPNDCFIGIDAFQYQADDFDTSSEGGRSASAAVSLFHPTVLNAGFNPDLPSDWTILDGYSDGFTWSWEQMSGETMMVVDSDAAGQIWMDESLITPILDCGRFRQVRLVFDHNFIFNSYEIADVDIRIDGGPWHNLARYQGRDAYGIADLDVSALAAGQRSVQFRWHYHDAWYDWFWAIFHVAVLGGSSPAFGDFDEDCDVDLSNFADLAAAWQSTEGHAAFNPRVDIAEPYGQIDLADLLVFAENWAIRLP